MHNEDLPQRDRAHAGLFNDPRMFGVLLLALVLAIWNVFEGLWAKWLNAALGHEDEFAAAGWSILTVLRVALSVCFVWIVVRLPQPAKVQRSAAATGNKAKPAGPRGVDPLLVLRAVACWLVMTGHYFSGHFLLPSPAKTASSVAKLLDAFSKVPSATGVWIFFTLSGYLMGKGFALGRYGLNAGGVRAFLRNRLLRIAPLYFASILLFAVFLQPSVFLPHGIWQLGLLSTFSYRGDIPFNAVAVLWSVCTEVHFYLLVPFLFAVLRWLHRRTGRTFWLVPLALLVGLSVVRLYGGHLDMLTLPWARQRDRLTTYSRLFYAPMLTNLDQFVCGMALNFTTPSTIWRRLAKGGFAFAAICAALYVCSVVMIHFADDRHYSVMTYMAFAPAIMAVMTAFAIRCSEQTHFAMTGWLSARLLRFGAWSGTLAYALYVFHVQALASLRHVFPVTELTKAQAFGFFPVAMMLVYAVATFFYRFVEEPFVLLKAVPDPPVTDAP